MKHCPQCEFTFGDNQQLCDFDGTELSPLPEIPPAFKHASLAPVVSRSFVRRVVQSRVGLAALALAGVALSALLIGYYDSVNQPNIDISTSQTENYTASVDGTTQLDSPAQGETFAQTLRRKSINTQRRITVAEKSDSRRGSMVKGEDSHPRSARSRSRRSNSKLVATKRKPDNAKRQSHARNQARPGLRDRRRQHVTARVTNQRPGVGIVARSNASPSAKTRLAVNESSHHKKDSRVMSLLKKTGKILKKPFELIAGR